MNVCVKLYGPIFFGSAEKLANEIENSVHEADYLILDMKRVHEIDSTGAKIINRITGMPISMHNASSKKVCRRGLSEICPHMPPCRVA